LVELGQHVVERYLKGIDARSGKMREVTLSRRTFEIQRRHQLSHLLEPSTGLSDSPLAQIDIAAPRRHHVFGPSHPRAQLIERSELAVELLGVLGHRALERFPLLSCLLGIGSACSRPGIQLGGSFLQAADVGREACRPFGQGGVGGLAFGNTPIRLVERFPGFEEPSLRLAQSFIGRVLLLLEPGD
jgi:hypothetical protein